MKTHLNLWTLVGSAFNLEKSFNVTVLGNGKAEVSILRKRKRLGWLFGRLVKEKSVIFLVDDPQFRSTLESIQNPYFSPDKAIDFFEYMAFTSRFFSHNGRYESEGLMYNIVGLSTEVAEILDIHRKEQWYGKPFDKDHVREEIGDAMWYLSNLIRMHGLTFQEVLGANRAKIEARYSNSVFTIESATNRDKDKEHEAMQESLK